MQPVTQTRFNSSPAGLLWLFPPALLIHLTEEFGGVGAEHGINLSLTSFLLLGLFGVASMVTLVLIARRLGFMPFVQLLLGTVFLVNAVSHTANTLHYARYNAGVVTGLLIFAPLGLLSILWLRGRMNRRKYFIAIAVGLGIHTAVTLIAM